MPATGRTSISFPNSFIIPSNQPLICLSGLSQPFTGEYFGEDAYKLVDPENAAEDPDAPLPAELEKQLEQLERDQNKAEMESNRAAMEVKNVEPEPLKLEDIRPRLGSPENFV
jgi:hypothetical protein